MITYAKEEMVGITELGKSLGVYLDKVTSHTLSKLAIIRRNKPEAIIVPIEEYEQMRAAADYFEELEIADVIQRRVKSLESSSNMITNEALLEKLRARGKNV